MVGDDVHPGAGRLAAALHAAAGAGAAARAPRAGAAADPPRRRLRPPHAGRLRRGLEPPRPPRLRHRHPLILIGRPATIRPSCSCLRSLRLHPVINLLRFSLFVYSARPSFLFLARLSCVWLFFKKRIDATSFLSSFSTSPISVFPSGFCFLCCFSLNMHDACLCNCVEEMIDEQGSHLGR